MQVQIGPYKDEGERQEHVVIHHYDTWSMDHTLALIILPMLKQLKATKHGAPNVDYEDVPQKLRPSEEWIKRYNRDGETDPYFFKRWDWIMDEMIWSFQHTVDDDWQEQFFHEDGMEVQVKEIKTVGIGPCQLRLFPDEFGEMEDYELYEWVRDENASRFDKEGYNKYQERISNGFRLFGKYYQSLWD